MPTFKAQGYDQAATAQEANQVTYNRGVWEPDKAFANGDKILIGKLPLGHRLIPDQCSLYVNAGTEAMNIDVCIAADANVLIDNVAVTADTAAMAKPANTAVPFTLAELLGVDYENDRDVYLVLNTAPSGPGGKVVVNYASYAASRGN